MPIDLDVALIVALKLACRAGVVLFNPEGIGCGGVGQGIDVWMREQVESDRIGDGDAVIRVWSWATFTLRVVELVAVDGE